LNLNKRIGEFDHMEEIVVIAVCGAIILFAPYYANAVVASSTATVKLINETFGSATEKQIQDTLTDPKK